MKNNQKILIVVGVLVFVIAFFLVAGFFVYSIFEAMFLDTKEVPCEELPTVEYVEKVVSEHNDTWMQIAKISVGWVSIDRTRCPGKADIVIYYAGETDRKKIKKLIGDDFFGVPYRLYNV